MQFFLYLIECFVRVGAESSLILIDLAESHQTARLALTTMTPAKIEISTRV